MGLRVGLDTEANVKILCLYRVSNLDRPVSSQILTATPASVTGRDLRKGQTIVSGPTRALKISGLTGVFCPVSRCCVSR
jgi:hypothetical protein